MFSSRNRVESNVVRMFWNDGLLDCLAGCGVLLMGVAWLFNLVPIGATAPAILIPMWKPLRAKLTEPRLGYVEFSDTQQQRNRGFLAMSIALGVLVLVGGVTVYAVTVRGSEFDARIVPGLPACIIGVLALMTAAVTAQYRFVIYSALLALCGAAVVVLKLEPGWALLAGGALVLSGGAITVSQFVSRYPLPAESK